MDKHLILASSPHIHSGRSTSRIMLDVIIALCPAAIAGVVIFGLRALLVLAVCIGSCVGFEALFNLIVKRKQTIGDLSAVVTGLLLGMNLPANIPIWQCVIGALFAMVVVKGLFGGLGNNPVNPAITARVFMLVAFGSMTKSAFPTIVDTVSTATPLSLAEGQAAPSLLQLFIGTHGGAIGETCAAALLVGCAYLLIRRVITWQIPITFIGTVFVCSLIMEGFNFTSALAAILSGGLMIGAIFMATDYVTSPVTAWGKVIFGIGAGLITFLIRYYGVYPEGVSFAILLMNIVTPYINSWTKHKVFGTGGAKK
ncbi:MAG: RnfABCDGE type electron transport complex subunit D [Clostridia bacterium]|nr:RnfABCDGE type electron transport complex subunit D [Clostridia bacterium]